jgi:hypothetical protein
MVLETSLRRVRLFVSMIQVLHRIPLICTKEFGEAPLVRMFVTGSPNPFDLLLGLYKLNIGLIKIKGIP